MATINENLLTIRGLKTYFYTLAGVIKAVDGVDLRVNPREAVGLVGESGCGKSTLALTIMRLVRSPPARIAGGEIVYKDKRLLKLSEKEMRKVRGKEISMVFQDPMTYLNPTMRIGDQVVEAILKHQRVSKEEARKKAVKRLENVGIASASKVARYYPHQLSGGMQQRSMIAMALSCDPSLLIADEPTTALDVTIQLQILMSFKKLMEDFEFSILLITHDLGIAADMCDRVYVMYGGKIVENADVFALYDNPMHPYTIGLLRSVLSIGEYKHKLETIDGVVCDLINPPHGCRFQPRCQHAKSICAERDPPLVEVETGHFVSCWRWS